MQTLNKIPENGMQGLLKYWKSDIVAGFLVFLIALPLCLGIAMASKFPPIAGIMTAVVGGLFVTLIQGSYVTIKGPAAGLIVIVLASVEALGKGDDFLGYKLTLAVIVVSGVIQLLLGLMRTGVLGDFFPSSAVHGMLAAIGIIIISKQIHTVLGIKPVGKEPLQLLAEIPNSILHMNPEIAFIGLLSLLILFSFPYIKNPYIKLIPAPMLVILLAIPLGKYFDLEHQHVYLFLDHKFQVDSQYLVNLPDNIIDGFHLPDFSQILTFDSFKYIIMFALVGSLESILSAKAVDILDPFKRKTNHNKDLFAVGLGNIICGFIGALPMISEIVRSSANINNKAKTKWSNFFHGAFLLLFVLLLPGLLKQIPLAALGAMLIFTGYRLASPKVFKEVKKVGMDQLFIFITTLIVTLATDLIIGIVVGIFLKLLLHVLSGTSVISLFRKEIVVSKVNETHYKIELSGTLNFANYLPFKAELDKLPNNALVEVDVSRLALIDHTVLENLHHYAEDLHRTGGNLKFKGIEKLTQRSSHPLSVRTAKKSSVIVESREFLMFQLGQKMGWRFTSFAKPEDLNLDDLNTNEKSIKYVGNILTMDESDIKIIIADISIVEGGTMKAEVQSKTIVMVNVEHILPTFMMTKEGTFDKLLFNSFTLDIDFDNHPIFSSRYKLTGDDERSVRKIFTNELIEYIEKNSIYTIQSFGNKLIFTKDFKIASPDEIIKIVEYARGFYSIIK
jgi:MFS superfamily sulfate permease-like transporter